MMEFNAPYTPSYELLVLCAGRSNRMQKFCDFGNLEATKALVNTVFIRKYAKPSFFPADLISQVNEEPDMDLRAAYFLLNGFLTPTARIGEVIEKAQRFFKYSPLIREEWREYYLDRFSAPFEAMKNLSPALFPMVALIDYEEFTSFAEKNCGAYNITREKAFPFMNLCLFKPDNTIIGKTQNVVQRNRPYLVK